MQHCNLRIPFPLKIFQRLLWKALGDFSRHTSKWKLHLWVSKYLPALSQNGPAKLVVWILGGQSTGPPFRSSLIPPLLFLVPWYSSNFDFMSYRAHFYRINTTWKKICKWLYNKWSHNSRADQIFLKILLSDSNICNECIKFFTFGTKKCQIWFDTAQL